MDRKKIVIKEPADLTPDQQLLLSLTDPLAHDLPLATNLSEFDQSRYVE